MNDDNNLFVAFTHPITDWDTFLTNFKKSWRRDTPRLAGVLSVVVLKGEDLSSNLREHVSVVHEVIPGMADVLSINSTK